MKKLALSVLLLVPVFTARAEGFNDYVRSGKKQALEYSEKISDTKEAMEAVAKAELFANAIYDSDEVRISFNALLPYLSHYLLGKFGVSGFPPADAIKLLTYEMGYASYEISLLTEEVSKR